jgi:threonine dehydratase
MNMADQSFQTRIPDAQACADAYARIRAYVRETPIIAVERSLHGTAAHVTLKLEFLQHMGSFKPRGAFNAALSGHVPKAGIAAASGGNHGAATAYVAKTLGHRATIFVPEIASPAKIAAIKHCGADVRIGGARYADALDACNRFIAETGAFSIHAYDTHETIAGQASVAREWDQQRGSAPLDTVLIAVGGGGLIAGCALHWAQSGVRVVGVEPTGSRALHAALAAGHPVDVDVNSVAADSLGARSAGALVTEIAKTRVDRVVLVEDAAITRAQAHLWQHLRVALEPGGAAAFAALQSGAYKPAKDERVGVLLCGANVDLAKLATLDT